MDQHLGFCDNREEDIIASSWSEETILSRKETPFETAQYAMHAVKAECHDPKRYPNIRRIP